MSATRIILYVKGGLIQSITADGPINVTLLDQDNRDEGDYDSFDDNTYLVTEGEGSESFAAVSAQMKEEWDTEVERLIEHQRING